MPNEPLPTVEIYEILDKYWNDTNTPKPRIHDVGADGNTLRINLERFLNTGDRDVIVLRPGSPAFDETPIGTWIYGNRVSRVQAEVYTKASRQRLYNVLREIRRITHLKMHTAVDYQRIRFVSFDEFTDDTFYFWLGTATLELVNNAVLLETT